MAAKFWSESIGLASRSLVCLLAVEISRDELALSGAQLITQIAFMRLREWLIASWRSHLGFRALANKQILYLHAFDTRAECSANLSS